jgi:hypothetical protein
MHSKTPEGAPSAPKARTRDHRARATGAPGDSWIDCCSSTVARRDVASITSTTLQRRRWPVDPVV